MKNLKYLILCFSIMLLSFCSTKHNQSVEWVETIGTIEAESPPYWIYYKIDDIQYRERFYLKNYGIVSGEKYSMRYNVDNHSEIEIEYWNPIFEKGETTHLTIGRIKRIVCPRFKEPKCLIDYVYEVNGEKIDKTQSLPPIYKKGTFNEGQSFQVEFWDKNVNRAVIYLDRPVK